MPQKLEGIENIQGNRKKCRHLSLSRKLITGFYFLPSRLVDKIDNAGLLFQKIANTIRFQVFWNKYVRDNPDVIIVPSFARVRSKQAIWDIALNAVNKMGEVGKILEFGAGNGGSLLYFWRHVPKTMHLIGYDCFEGLPEKWDSLPAGAIKGYGAPIELWADYPEKRKAILANLTPGKFPSPPQENISIEAGLFSQTVPKLFKDGVPADIRLLHFDADIYMSTRPILDIVAGPLNYRYYILFDEFYSANHEFKAWMEFVGVYKVDRWRVVATSEDGFQVLIELNY